MELGATGDVISHLRQPFYFWSLQISDIRKYSRNR